jgi:two-component system NtrC family sensor kinase
VPLQIRLRPSTREAIVAHLPAFAWLLAAGGVGASRPLGFPLFLALGLGGAALWAAARERRLWLPLLHLAAAVAGGLLAAASWPHGWWPGLAALSSAAALAAHFQITKRRIRSLDEERRALARQVDRRINEIFSLQELSYVLAESLQSERIAGQVARYVMRFLNAEGAAVALPGGDDGTLLVAAAEGSLAGSLGLRVTDASPSLLLSANSTERIEVTNGNEREPVFLLPGHQVVTGAAAPLRAHGLTMGVLAVADRRQGSFSAEDLWLLSTVATHVAVVMANSRLFEMVRQAKEEWETAFNALTEGIAVVDGRGSISRGNQALAGFLNVAPAALIGRAFWSAIVGEPEGEDRLIGAARRGERTIPLIVRSTTLDRILRLTAAPLGEPGADAAVVVLVEDVTEQRALEAQLIQSEKLAAVGQLVSGVAHELNNPLTSIAGLSEFLQERPSLPEAEREHMRVIREQADRAGRIVRNLLTFARKSIPGTATVDLNDILGRTALLVAYELRLRGIELKEERVDAPLPVRGNRDELQQVLLNLVNNAVHAVRGLPEGAPRRVTLTAALEQGQAVVRVRDTGGGVPAELVSQLFTPFFTTKDPGEGTGLGLSLSYRIVESHGGRLSYQAVPGGAEFWFSLPILRESGRHSPPSAPMPLVAGDRSALLVDSDPAAELVMRALMEPAGYAVEVTHNGAEALARLGARSWSLVVLDGAMSADGRRLLLDEIGEPDDYRLLVSTADAMLAARCRALGIPILPRPFLPRDLVGAVGDLLAPPESASSSDQQDQGAVVR